MPHIWIEYSGNLDLDTRTLMRVVRTPPSATAACSRWLAPVRERCAWTIA